MEAPIVVTAEAHANIALVKYWGKQSSEHNIPATPSLSLTLQALTSRTRITLDPSSQGDIFSLNGNPTIDPRVNACLERMRAVSNKPIPFVNITSENNFPTAAGLASSASGFAALVTALNELGASNLSAKKLSIHARMASGSAARSIYGGFVSLAGSLTDSKQETWHATQILNEHAWPMQVVVAICTEREKAISSSEGMQLTRNTSPYYDSWVASTRTDFDDCLQAVRDRDFERVATISEHSCLKMHGLMLSTQPGLIYWNPATIACIHAIRSMRASGVPVFFTIDAGPQLKAICLPEAADAVDKLLSGIKGVQRTLRTGLGPAARIVDSKAPASS